MKMLQKQSLKLYLLILSLFIAFFFIFFYLNFYYSIKTIAVEGTVPDNNLVGLGSLKNQNLILLSLDSIEKQLTNSNPGVKVESITKDYPDKLRINLSLIQPLAEIKLNSGYAVLSEDAKIMEKHKSSKTKLTVINFYQKFDYSQLETGEKLDYQELLIALYNLKRAQDLNLRVKSIAISGMSMIVFHIGDKNILLSGEKDKETQANQLETLLLQFKIKSQDFKVIDLRFDKPIVKF